MEIRVYTCTACDQAGVEFKVVRSVSRLLKTPGANVLAAQPGNVSVILDSGKGRMRSLIPTGCSLASTCVLDSTWVCTHTNTHTHHVDDDILRKF